MAMDPRTAEARRLYERALDLEPSERDGFLDRECGNDDVLRDTVADLLSCDAIPTGELAGVAEEPAAEAIPSGKLRGRYRLEGRLGRGGMGVVYAARDELLERPVAVKMLSGAAFGTAGRERFLREARAAAALNHPNVVAIYDAGEVDGRPYLVMEKIAGQSLERHPPRTLEDILEIAGGICAALEHAHARGLVHRDLKPANVLLADEGIGAERVKLTDLGIALARGRPRVTRTGAIAGTPTYMAPEQALGREVDARTDLYALGVMLYQWAVGRPPFAGDDALAVVSQHINAPVVPPRNLRPDLPVSFERIVLRLLSKEPSHRLESAGELRAALAAVEQDTGEDLLAGALAISGLARGRMVGRRVELERLQALWRATRVDGGHLVLLSGEPGVGKTRLARELIAAVGLEGGRVLAGGCYENEATTPYLPFVEALRQLVREEADADLRETLGDSAPEIARLAPEIESRLGPFAASAGLSPQEQRLRLFDHVARFFARLARPRGLLVFLDDLHWADPGSFDLLHDLLRNLRSAAVLVLATYRDVEVDSSHPLARALVDWERERIASRVPLRRLDRGGTRLLLATLLGQEEVSEELADDLHRETEGNPFFVEEIVKALVSGGGLVRQGGSWRRAPTEELVLPESLKSAIESRLDKIGEDCQRILRTAAVLGKDFDFTRLASIVDLGEDPLLDLLDEATAAQIVTPARGETFVFTHDKIREVLYDDINPVRRRRIHRLIGERLVDLRERGDDVAVEDLAFHFMAAGDNARGVRFALEAAVVARRLFAFESATTMLEQALACAHELGDEAEVVRVQETLGDVAEDRGDATRAAAAFETALATAVGEPLRSRLHVKAAATYLVSGDDRARRHAEAALAALDPSEHPLLVAEAEMIRGRFAHLQGELHAAAELYERALELVSSGPEDDPDLLVGLYSNLAGTYQHLAEFTRSDEFAQRCIELGERHDLPHGRMLGREFQAENAFYLGRWEETVRHGEIEEAEALEFQAGSRLLWSKFRGFCLHELGRLDEAARLAREALGMAQRTGELRIELFLRLILAEVALDTGRVAEAIGECRKVVEAADEASLLNHRISARGYLVRALIRAGRGEEAGEEARTALDLALGSESTGLLLIYGAVLAEALLAGGRSEEAGDILDRNERIARDTGALAKLAQNRRVRALLAAHRGDREGAHRSLDEAIEGLRATKTLTALALALGERAALQDDPAAAAADRARSEELQRELGVDFHPAP